MASFQVESCRRTANEQVEFVVSMLSGDLSEGDRFDCLDGMGSHVRFHIQRVEEKEKKVLIECSGPITFDDQFNGFTIVTTPYPPSRTDLPQPERMPELTDDDASFIKVCVSDWEYLHPLQQASVLCVLKGKKTYESISEELSISVLQIESAFKDLGSFILRDSSTGELYIK